MIPKEALCENLQAFERSSERIQDKVIAVRCWLELLTYVSLRPATARLCFTATCDRVVCFEWAQGLQITGVDLEVRLCLLVTTLASWTNSQRGFQNIFEGNVGENSIRGQVRVCYWRYWNTICISSSLLLTNLDTLLLTSEDGHRSLTRGTQWSITGGFRGKVILYCCALKIQILSRSTPKLRTHLQGDLVSPIVRQICLHLREWCQELLVRWHLKCSAGSKSESSI